MDRSTGTLTGPWGAKMHLSREIFELKHLSSWKSDCDEFLVFVDDVDASVRKMAFTDTFRRDAFLMTELFYSAFKWTVYRFDYLQLAQVKKIGTNASL